jgi:hypothetical protein
MDCRGLMIPENQVCDLFSDAGDKNKGAKSEFQIWVSHDS